MTQDISTNFVELNAFLKINGIENSGGRAKLLIREGNIKVNNQIETRNKRKLHKGDLVEYLGKKYLVEEKFLR